MPLPTKPLGLSPAVDDLGLGGMLSQEVAGETEEARKKRMAELQQREMMGSSGSPAAFSLLGGLGGGIGS